jgi:hypothetical protein
MYEIQSLSGFLTAIEDDPRINVTHISIYVALLKRWHEHQYENPVSVFSHEVMKLAKISGSATYHKSIKELHEYGYIKYTPSYNHFLGSLVYILNLE